MDSIPLSSNIDIDDITFADRLKSPVGILFAIMICVVIVCVVMWAIYDASFEAPQVILFIIACVAGLISAILAVISYTFDPIPRMNANKRRLEQKQK
jgi:uncharacterized integral membrane protein